MFNSCVLAALMIKKRTEQKFNYVTAKLIKYNVNNEYSSSSAVKSMPDYVRTEKNKREVKKRKKTAFVLN